MITAGSARRAGFAKIIEPASLEYNCASASVALICRSTTWLCVQANSNARSVNGCPGIFQPGHCRILLFQQYQLSYLLSPFHGVQYTIRRMATIGIKYGTLCTRKWLYLIQCLRVHEWYCPFR